MGEANALEATDGRRMPLFDCGLPELGTKEGLGMPLGGVPIQGAPAAAQSQFVTLTTRKASGKWTHRSGP